MVREPREIHPNATKKNRIPWNYMEHTSKFKMPSRTQSQENHHDNRKNTKKKVVDLVRGQGDPGSYQFCDIHRPSWKTALQTNPDICKSIARNQQKQKVSITRGGETGTALVVKSHQPGVANSPQRPNRVHHNGCIRPRVGCHCERHKIKRPLEQRAALMAQQPEGAMDVEGSPPKTGTELQGSDNSSSNRQQICGSIYHQRRRNKVTNTFTSDDRNSRIGSTVPDSPHSQIFTRKIQSDGRQPFKTPSNSRMDIIETHHTKNFQEMGHTINRPLCEFSISRCKSICKRRCTGSSMCFCERLQQDLALRTRLDISSTIAHTTCAATPGKEFRNIFISGPEVGENFLEGRIETESIEPTVQNLGPAQTSNRLADTGTSTGCREALFGGLEGTGWTNLVESWESDHKILLESAWRKSTLKTYRSAWERWCSWPNRKCPVDNPEPGDIAKFIWYLHNDIKLAPQTIAVHKSVVLTFANPMKSEALAKHPLIKQLLKAVALTKPPPRKPSTWDIGNLIKYLEDYNVNAESIFQISRHVAALLLLYSGRRIHDLTLLDIGDGFYENNEDHIMLWPRFGSKTDSTTYRQAGWRLSNDGPAKLNPVLWIRKLINISQIRRSARSNLSNLFITTRGKVKEASRTVIAGWIRTLFLEAKIQDSPGGLRAAVNSDLLINKNLDLDEVLKRGNWRSKDTFLRHYFKEVHGQGRNTNSRHIMPDLFTPV